MIQCTKTVFNQCKWSRQLLVLTPLPSNVGALFSAMTLQITKLQDGDLCSSAIRNSRPPAWSEGWRWPLCIKSDHRGNSNGDLNFLMQTFLSAFQEIPDTHFNFQNMIVSKTYNVEQSTQIILQIWWVCRDIHNWWSSLRVLMKSDNSICIKYSIRTRNYVIVLITFC